MQAAGEQTTHLARRSRSQIFSKLLGTHEAEGARELPARSGEEVRSCCRDRHRGERHSERTLPLRVAFAQLAAGRAQWLRRQRRRRGHQQAAAMRSLSALSLQLLLRLLPQAQRKQAI